MDTVTLDNDGYDYVFDNASMCQINEKDPHDSSMLGFRCFGLPRGFAQPFGVPGHYLINNTTEESVVHVVQFPAMAQFVDPGIPDRLAVCVKRQSNGKLFVICVDTPLAISGTEETQKWALFKDAATVKMSVIKGFTAAMKHDGNNVLKNLDKWLKDHCSLTKALKIQSVKDCRSWCHAGKYGKNVALVIDAAELNLRRGLKSSTGGTKGGAKQSKAKGAQEAHAVERAAIETQVRGLQLVKEQLLANEPYYKAALATRIIEFALPAALGDASVDTEELEQLIEEESSPQIAIELNELLLKSTVASIVAGGKAPPVLASPAVKPKPKPTPAPVEVVEEEEVVEMATAHDVQDLDSNSIDGGEEDEEGVVEVEEAPAGGKKRERVQTQRLADEPLPAAAPALTKKQKVAAKKAALAAEKSIKKDKEGPKRSYVRTGLHSRDIFKAAAARAVLGGLSGLEGSAGVASPDFSSPQQIGDRPNSNWPNSQFLASPARYCPERLFG
jgi:hypothetical protein